MKVVFLDFDGVLNHAGTWPAIEARHKAHGSEVKCRCMAWENMVEPAAVARLNALLDHTGAVVVISSSWRKALALGELDRVLRVHGFTGKIVGRTPDLPNDEAWKASTRGAKWTDAIERGHEIEEWILDSDGKMILWPEPDDEEAICRICNCSGERMFGCPGHHVDEFVILDDCCDMARVRSALVQTSGLTGLTDADIEDAVAKMAVSPAVLDTIRAESAS